MGGVRVLIDALAVLVLEVWCGCPADIGDSGFFDSYVIRS
jgi:hypothetical protein